uniref:Phage tail protein n=1 Tax=Helicotheca tamesis TaxID=374047 RepID=A0A6U0HSM1_9STRA|mmetsp:Transcript_9170/g.12748  ORF Transcript_9170/g.12748 Transcript_9170/m.12748 type:complete len:184 (+) Transcript_9170:133-684(+)|eukprot:CAMPEP_0185728554 /NCGR_PEP_ID=MMETSP1171-20130828/3863_1 /TAXON_ID=374046 /ORGANISM="Helicotheca tamensis, Strain CCMP826" /LENGTH=183 /DNA_ID=CAMNT_0028397275 /DNA_START=96 /DNA_END=647 /DNA_ORIENTATION=+
MLSHFGKLIILAVLPMLILAETETEFKTDTPTHLLRGRDLGPNRRAFDHIGNFNFKVEIEGVTAGKFVSVDGLQAETEIIEYQDGDDIMLRKRPGRTKYSNITLKRGYTGDSELWNWYAAVANGRIERKAGSIILLGNDKGEIERYNFFEAWPVRYRNFVLDGEGRDSLLEEIEIAVERVERG